MNPIPFTFSIRGALKDSWNMFVKHWQFFTVMAFVMIVFKLFSNDHVHNPFLIAAVIIAAMIWSYVWISVSLAAVDGKEDILNFNSLSVHMPDFRQFFTMLGVSIVMGLIIAGGFILLIIPGIYFLVRLAFATIAYVDRQGTVGASLRFSWHLVKGKIFWTVFLVMIVEVALMILGVVTLLVGTLIAYPLAMLLVVHLYRALIAHQKKAEAATVPAEQVIGQ